jgi:hypothetical protein
VVNVHVISPQNEVRVAQRLAEQIRRAWPDVAQSPTGRIDLLVGVRSETDVDLLVAIDLAQPRDFAAPHAGRVQHALIAIEIKQLDASRFARIGNQLFADYGRGPEHRSVADQARDAAYGVKAFALRSGFPRLFVYGLAWLTEVDETELRDVDPAVVPGSAGWFGLLDAAAVQNDVLFARDDAETSRGVRAVRDRFLNRRQLSAQDRRRAAQLAQDVVAREIVDLLAPAAGTKMTRLAGRGGSGKTTALTLLANRLATLYGGRVLLLTFHHALCGDIRHLLEGMPEARALLGDRIHVETATSFLLAVLKTLTGHVPTLSNGKVDYGRLDEAFASAAVELAGGPDGDMATALRGIDAERFDWDHVLIDEAQDWTDGERDFLRAIYGHRRFAIADGLEQLVRRQTPCDWLSSVPRAELQQRVLDDSLRMLRNVALFANAFARAAGFVDWRVTPRDDLPGGRIIVAVGPDAASAKLVRAMHLAAATGKADPVDCLVCVPYTDIDRHEDGSRHARFGAHIEAAGFAAWDACDGTTRTTAPASTEVWRIVQYDSCRGLEGWVTLALDLDELYAQKLRHPNYHRDDRQDDVELVARRWLLIPLTRAVHTLIITVRDPDSPVAAMLREAANAMPQGVVEWCSAAECAGRVAPVPATVLP